MEKATHTFRRFFATETALCDWPFCKDQGTFLDLRDYGNGRTIKSLLCQTHKEIVESGEDPRV